MTLDGAIAWPLLGRKKHSRWITSRESRNEVQRMRHASDAIITGIGTVLADDPALTDRTGRSRRRPLLRVILDSRLRLPPDSKLVRSAKGDLLIFTAARIDSPKARRLLEAGAEIVRVQRTRAGLNLRAILRDLARRNILSVLIEAGTRVNSAALLARIPDKLVIFSAGIDGRAWGNALGHNARGDSYQKAFQFRTSTVRTRLSLRGVSARCLQESLNIRAPSSH